MSGFEARQSGVETVNGDAGPAVVIDAADISAEPAGAVAAHVAELDPHVVYTKRGFVGSANVVASLADLDAFAPAVAGVRTITTTVFITSAIALPAGERIVVGPLSVLSGISSASCRITGDVDDALISGPVVTDNVAFANTNAGPNAKVFAISSAVGRVCRVEYCSINAGAKAGTIGPLDNIIALDRLLMNGCNGGFVYQGVVVIAQATRCAAVLPAGSTAFTAPNGLVVARAMSWDSCNFITSSSADRGIRVESGVVFASPSPAICIQVTGSTMTQLTANPADIGRVWDENPGALTRKDPRVVLKGNVTEPDSLILGDAAFSDTVTPIVSTYVGPAPTPWLPIAHQNAGSTSQLTLLSVSARFILFRNGGDPQDWYIEYIGPNRTTAEISFSVTAAAVSGGGAGELIEYRLDYQPAGGGWGPVDGSDRPLEQRANYTTVAGGAYLAMSFGDRFRVSRRNTTATSSTKIANYTIVVKG